MNDLKNKSQNQGDSNNDLNSDLRPVFSTMETDLPQMTDMDNPSPANTILTPPADDKNKPSKKYPGNKGKFFATILGVLLLIGGVGAGLILVRQQQNVSEKARVCECDSYNSCGPNYHCSNPTCGTCIRNSTPIPPPPPPPPNDGVCTPGATRQAGPCTTSSGCTGIIIQLCNAPGTQWYDSYCDPDPDCANKSPEPVSGRCVNNGDCANGYICNSSGFCVAGNTDNSTCGRDQDPTAPVCCTNLTECPGGDTNIVCEPTARKECKSTDASGKEFWCLMEANSDWCSGSGGGGNPTNPPATGSPTAMCLDIRAYDANWIQMTAVQLGQIKTGDILRFTVRGQTTSGIFTKARFTINGVLRSEVTAKKPDTEEFVDEYTVPSDITQLTIKAEVYHESLGWK